MQTSVFASVFLLMIAAAPAAWAQSQYCSDIDAVVKEGIAYHLTGAPTTNLPLDCALKTKWKFFDPTIERREGEPSEDPSYVYFDPNRDTYQIKRISKAGEHYLVQVEFKLGGRTKKTQYTYSPNRLLQRYKGVCGTVIHPNQPWIFRKDCRRSPASAK